MPVGVDSMNIILKVTEKCNLKCSYCYEHLFSSSYRLDMSEVISKLDNTEVTNLIYHGGEPLILGMNYYERIQELLKSHNLIYKQSLQTNGLLLNSEWQDFLIENAISYSVSVDFAPEVRQQLNLKELEYISKKDPNAGVIVVIHKKNISKLIEIYKTLVDIGYSTISFNLIYSGYELTPTLSEYKTYYTKFYQYLTTLPEVKERTFLYNCVNYLNLDNVIQCSPENCRYNWLTIRINGDIYPCERIPILLGNVKNVSKLNNIFETEKYEDYVNSTLGLQVKCLNCPARTTCRTGCFCNHDILNKTLSEYDCGIAKYTHNILENIFGKR